MLVLLKFKEACKCFMQCKISKALEPFEEILKNSQHSSEDQKVHHSGILNKCELEI